MRYERRLELMQERQNILVRVFGYLLEIDHEALRGVALQECHELLTARLTLDRVSQKARKPGTIPFAVARVLQHWQNAGRLLLLMQEVYRFLIDDPLQLHVGAGKLEPARHHPVELRQRRLERRKAA